MADNNVPAVQLRCIELSNFKSYRGRHVMGPLDRSCAVIGPNGAGKSNLMDAIAFAMGSRSVQLRSTNLSSLAYRSLKGDTVVEETSTFVALVFRTPLHGEARFQRSVVSDSGTSAYSINDTQVSVDVYISTLQSYSISAKTALIFQGDVVEVARHTPTQLGQLFERVSGSDQFISAYIKLEAEGVRIRANLKLLSTQRERLLSQKAALQTEVTAWSHHQQKLADLQKARGGLVAYRLYRNETKAYSLQKRIDTASSEETECQNRLKEVQHELRQLDAALAQMEADISENNRGIELCTDTLRAATAEWELLSARHKVAMERSSSNRHAIEVTRGEILSLETLIAEKRRLSENCKASLNQLSFQSHARDECRGRSDFHRWKSTLVARSANLKQQIDRGTFRLNEALRRLDVIEDTIAKCRNQQLRWQQSLETCVARLHTLEEQRGDIAGLKAAADSELQALECCLTDYMVKSADARRNICRLESRLDSMNRVSDADLPISKRLNETVEALRNEFPQAVHGVLADLYQPSSSKYAIATAVALGKLKDAVVVDRFETVERAIVFLRENRFQSLNFLPLADLKPQRTPQKFAALGGVKVALDCFIYDAQYSVAFEVATSMVVIVDTLSLAEKLIYVEAPLAGFRLRAVTLDGDRIMRNGNYVIDRTQKSKSTCKSNMNAVRQVQQEMQQAVSSTLHAPVESLYSAREQVVVRRRDAMCKLSTIEADIEQMVSCCKQFERHMEDCIQKLRECEARKLICHEEASGSREVIQRLRTKLQMIEDDTISQCGVAPHTADLFKNAIREEREQLVQEEEQVFLQSKGAKLCAEIKSLLSRQQELQQYEKRLSDVAAEPELCELDSLTESCLTRMRTLSLSLDEMNAAAGAAQQKREHYLKQMADKGEVLRTITRRLALLRGTDISLRADLDSLTNEAMDLLKEMVYRSLPIPMKTGTSKDFAILLGVIPKDATFWATPTIDYAAIFSSDELACFDSDVAVAEMIKRQETLILRLEAEVAAIPVSANALSKNQKVEAELTETLNQIQLLDRQRREVDKSFNAVRVSRLQKFMACFHHTQAAVTRIYGQLTQTTSSCDTATGQAFLELEEDPSFNVRRFRHAVQFSVMPPHKRISDIRRLSGGEKSIAALALLLALYSYNAASLCVMDEVDAALDPNNVASLGAYIENVDTQILFISHSDRLFAKARQLIGIYVDTYKESSVPLMLALRRYTTSQRVHQTAT